MVILVTGASRGIGKEIARKMAEKGNSVIANYNKSEKEAEKLQKENDNIEIYKADVSNRTEVHEMIQNILKKYGKIDVMINNAGISEEKMPQILGTGAAGGCMMSGFMQLKDHESNR